MKKTLCILLVFVCVLTAYPQDRAQAADLKPASAGIVCDGIRLKPTMFTQDGKLILKETNRTFADDLTLFMIRFQVVDGYVDESTLKKLADDLRLYYIEQKIQGIPWDTVSFGKKISTFDLIYASREISSLAEACLYCSGTRYSLDGLAKTGKALTAANKPKGKLVTLRPTVTPKPAFTPTPKPTNTPRVYLTPSPDQQAELTEKMKDIRDSVKAGDTMPTLRGKLFIVVFDAKDKIKFISSSSEWARESITNINFSRIPEEWLADSYEEADTVILIYREKSQVGAYQWGSIETGKAYAAYTRLAILYRGSVQVYAAHTAWPPSKKNGKGDAVGDYDYTYGLLSVKNAKWQSLDKK